MSLNKIIAQQFINNPLYTNLYNKYKDTSVIISDTEFMQTINVLKSKRKGMETINSLCFNHKHTDIYNFLSYDNILRHIVTDYILNFL